MLTCITHVYTRFHEVCRLTSPMYIFELLDLSMSTYIKHYLCWHISNIFYADIHHPWVQLKSFIQVCWLGSWSMLTYITQWYIWIALSKYVNIIFCSWNPQVCWYTSPNARSYKVCWLASPMCILYFMDYADLHHPVIWGLIQVCKLIWNILFWSWNHVNFMKYIT